MNFKKALLLTLSDPSGDPRPRRGYDLLSEMNFLVDTYSYKIEGNLKPNQTYTIFNNHGFRITKIFRKFLIGISLFINNILVSEAYSRLIVTFWFNLNQLEEILESNDYDVLIVEDLYFLPIIFKYKKNEKIIFDAREYYPLQREDSLLFRILEKPIRNYFCQKYLILCNLFITVSYGLADKYENEYGIKAHVIRSTPYPVNISIKRTNKEKIKIVHHGVANKNRKIENMIKLIDLLDTRFTLDLYLQGDQKYIKELIKFSKNNKRIKICKPVLFNNIISMLNKYDIGLFYVEPTTFNLTHCLPNKLFEFIQARIMVAIGPSPDMSKIVNEYECGIVSKNFDLIEMAKSLNELNFTQINFYKEQSEIAAKKLNWIEEKKIMQNLIFNL
jgi:hypothetical protein